MPPVITALTPHHPLPDGDCSCWAPFRSVTGAMTRVAAGRRPGAGRLRRRPGRGGDRLARPRRRPRRRRGGPDPRAQRSRGIAAGAARSAASPGRSTPRTPPWTSPRMVLADGLRLQGGDAIRRPTASCAACDSWPAPCPTARRSIPAAPGCRRGCTRPGTSWARPASSCARQRSRVIVSGDLGRPDTPILPDYNTRWDPGPPVDVAVLEATYGDRDHAGGHGDVEAALERILRRAIADGGHILVPAFAIGRTQLLLYHLNSAGRGGPAARPAGGAGLAARPQGHRRLPGRAPPVRPRGGRQAGGRRRPARLRGLYAVKRASGSDPPARRDASRC